VRPLVQLVCVLKFNETPKGGMKAGVGEDENPCQLPFAGAVGLVHLGR
jgi:hypothetical protein